MAQLDLKPSAKTGVRRVRLDDGAATFEAYPAAVVAEGFVFTSGARAPSMGAGFAALPAEARGRQQGFPLVDLTERLVSESSWGAHANLEAILAAAGSNTAQILRQHVWQADKRFFPCYEKVRMHCSCQATPCRRSSACLCMVPAPWPTPTFRSMPSPASEHAAGHLPWAGPAVLDHVGIAVPDLAQATALYATTLGCPVSPPRVMPDHGIAVVFVETGAARIELIAPFGAVSPITDVLEDHAVQDFLARQPAGGLHHVCYSVDDLPGTLARLNRAGLRTLGRSGPVLGASGLPIVFLDPGTFGGVLIELKGRAAP